MNLTDQNQREKEFHNELQSKSRGRFENIFYKAIFNSNEDFFKFLEINAINSEVLDFGCGIGSSLEKVVKFSPKKVTGIDISEVSILKAKNKVKESDSEIELLVGNCEQTKFNSNNFDIVYGTGILHHLDMSMCLDEIKRVLKPGGKFIFIEPLGTNPLINFYRKLTPKSRSKDEHPLVKLDFDLIEKKFINTQLKYYGFLTLIFFPFYKSPKKSNIFKFLKTIDQFLFKLNIFKKFAWSVLIIAQKN
tara:strand:+ start:324 stop:1067 length:744 start_codon:yes stop_codon:yes gene_type:complete